MATVFFVSPVYDPYRPEERTCEPKVGIEPTKPRFADVCITSLPLRRGLVFEALRAGLEPATS